MSVRGARIAAAAILVIGCSTGEVTDPGGLASTPTVTSITLAPSGGATIPARGTAQLTAAAYDANQQQIPGQAISYLSSDTAVITVNGTGLVTSVGPVGSAMVTANAGGVHSAAVLVTVVAGAAASIVKVQADPTVVVAGSTFNDSVRVRVLDAGSNAVAGVTVTFAITKGGGTIAPVSATTDQHGRAAAQFTTDSVQGLNVATASAGSLAPVAFSITTAFGYATLVLTPPSAVGVIDQFPDTDSHAPPNSWWVGLKCNPPSLVLTAGDSIANVSIVGWPWTTGTSAEWIQQFLQTAPMIPAARLGSAASLSVGQSLPLWSGPQLFYYSAPFPSGTRWPWTASFRVTYTVISTGKTKQADLQWQCQ